jgi:hypothetical protein
MELMEYIEARDAVSMRGMKRTPGGNHPKARSGAWSQLPSRRTALSNTSTRPQARRVELWRFVCRLTACLIGSKAVFVIVQLRSDLGS